MKKNGTEKQQLFLLTSLLSDSAFKYCSKVLKAILFQNFNILQYWMYIDRSFFFLMHIHKSNQSKRICHFNFLFFLFPFNVFSHYEFIYCRYKGASGSSAVCAFSMAEVERAFSGRYREVNRETQQWYTYNHPVPEPRPGAVRANTLRQEAEFSYTAWFILLHFIPLHLRGNRLQRQLN